MLLALAAGAAADPPERAPVVVRIGGITLRPGGFLEAIGETRSQSDADSVSTHFGSIPLTDTGVESVASLAHSRVMLKAERTAGPVAFTTYLESDFLNPVADSAPWRWRQYWGSARVGGWEILGGQAWSLLRPNREGMASDTALMNTDVIEPAYHVGLGGARRRQVRVGRTFGRQHAAVAWENNGNYVAKIATDRGFGHLEAAAFSGRSGRRGASASGFLRLSGRLRLATQEMWSHRDIAQALSLVPPLTSGFSVLEGVEAQCTKRLEVYAYAGIVYGDRSTGNRAVRQTSTGFNYRIPAPAWRGAVMLSLQYSYLDRAVWDGRTGQVHYAMYRLRYTFN